MSGFCLFWPPEKILSENFYGVFEYLKYSVEWALSNKHKKSGVPENFLKSDPAYPSCQKIDLKKSTLIFWENLESKT